MKNRIGWCNTTWNPVWGCNNHCEYCYARKIAKRFWKQMWAIELNHYWEEHPTWAWTGDHLWGLKDFKSTFLKAQFDKEFPKKTQKIFVGSMSEIAHWEEEWIERVIEKTKEYSQHTFQFLTRHPEAYKEWAFPENCWLGVTVTREEDLYNRRVCDFLGENANLEYNNMIKFISFEPLLERIEPNFKVAWVIIGAETGNRKDKIIPKKEWIENIVDYCKRDKTPVYLKDSLKEIYPVEIKEFPNYK